MIEADLYGKIHLTHVAGTRNGIGGWGDAARNGFLSGFLAPGTARNRATSSIVPMISHVDHTGHDAAVVAAEQGLADLRGLSTRQRAR